MDRINRITTTASARVLIECNMLRRSQLVACCSIKAKNTLRVATIRLLLKFQVTLDLRGSTRVFADAIHDNFDSDWRACPTTGTPARTTGSEKKSRRWWRRHRPQRH